MVERMYKKGLVVGIIVLFIIVGFQPALAVDTNQSNKIKTIDSKDIKSINSNGPDLKIEKVYLTWGWKGNYWVCYVTCDVTNIGEPVDGTLDIRSEVWRWKYFTKTFEPYGYTENKNYPQGWGSLVTKTITGAFATDYSNGLYRIKFNIKITGDVNHTNNCFTRCFRIKSDIIYPSNPFDAPPEEGNKELPVKNKLVETSVRIHRARGITPYTLKLTEKQSDEIDRIFDDLKVSLDSAETDDEIDEIYDDAVESLYELGMFPRMTIEEAKQLINCKSVKSQSGYLEGDENFNCRVIGWTTNTVMFDLGRLLWDIILEEIIRFLFPLPSPMGWNYNFRYYDGKIGSITLGSAEYGGMGDHYSPAKGWVWTNGTNGVVKWNGSFYGKEVKDIYWDGNMREGLCAFAGVSNFNGLWITGHVTPAYFVGNADHVKITYEQPPTPFK